MKRLAICALALASSVVMFLMHTDAPGIALVPLDHGAAFALGGRF